MALEETGFNVTVAFLALCIFLSNLIVLMAIIKAEHLHIPSNIFVAGIAIADALVGAIGLPFRFVVSLNLEMDYQSCLYITCIYLFTLLFSLYMLLAFTFDRLYAIRFPFKYHQNVDCRNVIIAISVVLTICLVIEVLLPTNWMVGDNKYQTYAGICSYRAVMTPEYDVYVNFSGKHLGTLLILIIVNTYIMCVVDRHKRHNMRQRQTIAHLTRSNDVRKKDLKAEKMIVCMIAIYVVCCLPIYISIVYMYFGGHVDKSLYRALLILYFLNSLANPFIYAVGNKRIRRACKNLIMCRPLNKTSSMFSQSTQDKKSVAIISINVSTKEELDSPADNQPKESLKKRSTISSLTERLSDYLSPKYVATSNNNISTTEKLYRSADNQPKESLMKRSTISSLRERLSDYLSPRQSPRGSNSKVGVELMESVKTSASEHDAILHSTSTTSIK